MFNIRHPPRKPVIEPNSATIAAPSQPLQTIQPRNQIDDPIDYDAQKFPDISELRGGNKSRPGDKLLARITKKNNTNRDAEIEEIINEIVSTWQDDIQ